MSVRQAKNFMWWALIKSSLVLTTFFGCNAKSPSQNPHATLYLASSLVPLKEHLEKNAPKGLIIDLIFESSSLIAQHIAAGAPCDAVIVADERWHKFLLQKNLVEDEARIVAHNALVIASLTQTNKTVSVTEFFASLKSQKLIIADPAFVPLGNYSQEALSALGIFTHLKGQFVMAHSAQNALTLLKQGLAPFAVLYASDTHTPGVHRLVEIEHSLHKPISYPFLVCKRANREFSRALAAFIFSPASFAVLKKAGFGIAL